MVAERPLRAACSAHMCLPARSPSAPSPALALQGYACSDARLPSGAQIHKTAYKALTCTVGCITDSESVRRRMGLGF